MNAAPQQTIVPCAALEKIIPAGILPALAVTVLVLAVLLSFAPGASAQSPWNRSIDAVAVVPQAGAGRGDQFFDVFVVLDVRLEPTSTPLDLSTQVDLAVNGVVVASNVHTIGADAGSGFCVDGGSCGGSCGSGSVDGIANTLLCLPDGPCPAGGCDCHCTFPSILSGFPGVPLQPQDEIMVILYPAPGAMPDFDTSDDQRIITYEGDPILWDIEIVALDLAPSAAGPGWDIEAQGAVKHIGLLRFAEWDGSVPLGFDVELRINGTTVETGGVPFNPLPITNGCNCDEICAQHEGVQMFCEPDPDTGCTCYWSWSYVFPAVPVDPGDEIMVLLRPAPGALPPLPGFEDDDEVRRECCGATGVEELGGPLGQRLEQNTPNPFDSRTTIGFVAGRGEHVKVEVFDVIGRRVRTLADRAFSGTPERHTVSWDARGADGQPVPAGVYFYRLAVDGNRGYTRKLTVTR
jgi:hypothetical protein